LVSDSDDGTMRVCSVATGAQKEEFDGEGFAFSKDSSLEQKVGKYSVQYHLQGRPVAHLRRPVGCGLLSCPTRVISAIGRAGERIGVDCKKGEMLQLRAD